MQRKPPRSQFSVAARGEFTADADATNDTARVAAKQSGDTR